MNDIPEMQIPLPPHPDYRAGMIAVVGCANAGKSSLINKLLGEKVSIVSPVVQTTRNVIRGIHSEERGQIVFLDTPGVHQARGDLGKLMNKMARQATEGVDVVLYIMDASRPPRIEDDGWMRRLTRLDEAKPVFILNKRDLQYDHQKDYRELWKKISEEKECTLSPKWLETSAETGDGLPPLLDRLFEHMPLGPPLFPEDMISDFPRKLLIADVIREKLFMRLHKELPHSVAVWVEEIKDTPKGGWAVEAFVYVRRNSQKGIVIGNKGRLLKSVGYQAGGELADIYDRQVKIKLLVKVEKDWEKNFWFLKRLGYA